MMPALDCPGLIRPGQFGPMIRVVPLLLARRCRTPRCPAPATPSVMTTTSGMPASIASIAAALVKAAGTKTTDDVGAGLLHRLLDGAEDRDGDAALELDGRAGLARG